ncbi:MAG: RHS repeat-associated core domain-containing protein, partial [Defluviitaleaceae bacterium]|nr:RHS repeat-associated core domain-containing protein [Defluviitaleaceae bacterium]
TYTYDLRTGNMLSRRNPFNGQNETFTYDALNRLTTGVTFSPCGNILSKEGVGNFIYDPVRRHAVERIEGGFGLRDHSCRLDHDITYTSFQKVNTIMATNFLFTYFIYGPNRQRRKMEVILDGNFLTRHYGKNFEVSYINWVREETKEYIFSPFGLVAIRNNGHLNAVATDHLGSIVARFNPHRWAYEYFGFTAWGLRYRYGGSGNKFFFYQRHSWDFNSSSPEFLDYFARGFTGHEHLDLFGLINMNGRLYDPTIGRFLSPDPFVPDATFTQDFNRYMYARNNPLSYIDPSGEIVIPILIGAAISGTVGFFTGRAAGLSGSDLFFHTFASATIGAISGGMGAAVGAGVASSLSIGGFAGGAIAGAAGGAAGGFTSGLFTTALNNTMFGMNNCVFGAGLRGGLIGGLAGGITGGIAGGIQQRRQNLIFQRGVSELGIDGGGAVPATDAFLLEAQRAWFPDAPMDNVGHFTTENIPSHVRMADRSGNTALGRTIPRQLNGKFTGISDVYFSKSAFGSARQLFITMGHEFVHVNQFAALAGQSSRLLSNRGFMEFIELQAYQHDHRFQSRIGNSFDLNLIRNFHSTHPSIVQMLNHNAIYGNLPLVWPF